MPSGRPKLPPEQKRRHRLTLYLTDAERADLEMRAGGLFSQADVIRGALGWPVKPKARFCTYCGAERTKEDNHHCWGHDRP